MDRFDQDGSFELLGDLGSERIINASYPNNGSGMTNLSEGYYSIALFMAKEGGLS